MQWTHKLARVIRPLQSQTSLLFLILLMVPLSGQLRSGGDDRIQHHPDAALIFEHNQTLKETIMVQKYRPPKPVSFNSYQGQALRLQDPVAVYGRHSTFAQTGNLTTQQQTDDMVSLLRKWGWQAAQIIEVVMEEGVSGRKKIQERPGLKQIFEKVEAGTIGTVATVHEDRLFRDLTQIESNRFIEACRVNGVQVLTPNMIYDFAHPVLGQSHIKLFRDKIEEAANFLRFHIYGRLLPARHQLGRAGLWDGRPIIPGFMVDMRKKVDGKDNPNFRKYDHFQPYADIVLGYFELFLRMDRNLLKTWQTIEEQGLSFSPIDEEEVPRGFKVTSHLRWKSADVMEWIPSYVTLGNLLTNVLYIGHWTYGEEIVQWHNHKGIIPEDIFMQVFNSLSPVDFLGQRNPHYAPQRPFVRHDASKRGVEKPAYEGLVKSNDVEGTPQKTVIAPWDIQLNAYTYRPYAGQGKGTVWSLQADTVDQVVGQMLLERLQWTRDDPVAWRTALDSIDSGERSDIRRIETSLRTEQQALNNLTNSLRYASHKEVVAKVEADFEATQRRVAWLSAQLEQAQAQVELKPRLENVRAALVQLTAKWDQVDGTRRRALIVILADYIEISRTGRLTRRITIHWNDGEQSSDEIKINSRSRCWPREDTEKLRQMIEANVDQVEILKAFPEYRWRNIMDHYGHHFNGGRWTKTYTGRIKYSAQKRWEDTMEYWLEQRSQTGASDDSLTTVFTRPPLRPFDWFTLADLLKC